MTQLFMMNPDGSDVRQLTRGPHGNFYGTWSWDASKIVFSSSEGSTTAGNILYVMNSDGTGRRALPVRAYSGHWSPGGKMIAFSSVPNGEAGGTNSVIFLINADGTNLFRISPEVSYWLNEGISSWSPDGKSILFQSNRDHPDSLYSDIYSMNIETKEVKRLTYTHQSFTGSPSFSPDGSKIGYSSNSFVKLMNSDGTSEKVIIEGYGFGGWSPDGKQLLISDYLINVDKVANYIINVDGSGLRQLLADDAAAQVTDWSK